MSGFRKQRIADQIQQALARLIREELRDPRLGFVTITEVDMSPDLKHARIFVSTLEEDNSSIETLERAAPFLRRSLARLARLRHTPELHFTLDETLSRGLRVERILGEVLPEEEPESAASDGEKEEQ